jgi:hypothetical protein
VIQRQSGRGTDTRVGHTGSYVIKVIALFNSVTEAKKVATTLVREMVGNDPKTGEETTTIAWRATRSLMETTQRKHTTT